MGIASGVELRHFLEALRSPRSFRYVAARVLAYGRDRLRHGRGMRLVNGNALVAGLAASAFEVGVDLRLAHPAQRLLTRAGRVAGAVVDSPEGPVRIDAARGVVLACGGFAHDVTRRKELLSHAPTGHEHWSAASRGNTGDGLRMAEALGARVAADLAQAAALAPVSLVPRTDGSIGHFPHLIERAKPGLIAVRSDGRRFVNEAASYHDFLSGLIAATPRESTVEAWLVCDHAFIRRYGIGAVKPAPMPIGRWLRNGYLRRGRTLAELAAACDIDPRAFESTVQRYNAMAASGRDDDFHKGENAYDRVQGDAAAGLPNPCMAELARAPFYAVKVVAGSLGTFAGLRVDARARVLDGAGRPIPGLHAAGNDMASVMGGHYPSGGITLGPAMTFGFIAAHDVAGRPLDDAGSKASDKEVPGRFGSAVTRSAITASATAVSEPARVAHLIERACVPHLIDRACVAHPIDPAPAVTRPRAPPNATETHSHETTAGNRHVL